MKIEEKSVGKNGVNIHTKISPSLVAKIARIAKENKTRKSVVINTILMKALK
jgi:dihydroorotate dehydrogenase